MYPFLQTAYAPLPSSLDKIMNFPIYFSFVSKFYMHELLIIFQKSILLIFSNK